jgi:phosphoribosylamine---glycine ligase
VRPRTQPRAVQRGRAAGGSLRNELIGPQYRRSRIFETPGAGFTLGAMRVLIVGSGGREHALAWKIAQSPRLEELHAAPGNPGIAGLARCHPVRADDDEALIELAREARIDLVVIGPEAPLVAGVADALRHAGVPVFGPGKAAARIEGSKSFAKEVMRAAGVPAAAELDEARAPCVIKADGLAAGKGVFVCRTQREADAAIPKARALGSEIVIEELLEGEEVSLFCLADGADAVPLPPAQDSKRLLDGDEGPNTGGMGSYAPVPFVSADEVDELVETVHRPVLAELAARGAPFVGLLYAGLMLADEGPRVLEFNCRFGDPETQAIVPLLDGDLLDALERAAAGRIGDLELSVAEAAGVSVVLASAGYPAAPELGAELRGLDDAEATGAMVFHAGTALRENRLVSAGGRVLDVTAVAPSLAEARERAYDALARIELPGAHHRSDIALKALRVAD